MIQRYGVAYLISFFSSLFNAAAANAIILSVVVSHYNYHLFSDCNCDIRGTENGSVECDESSQCWCKQYVTGLRCDACLSGFFGLDANNTDGDFI